MQSLWLLSFPSKALGIHAIKSPSEWIHVYLSAADSVLIALARWPWGSCSDKNTVVKMRVEKPGWWCCFLLVSCFLFQNGATELNEGFPPTTERYSFIKHEWLEYSRCNFLFSFFKLENQFPKVWVSSWPILLRDQKSSLTQSPQTHVIGRAGSWSPRKSVQPAPSMHAEVTFTPNFSEF